MLLLLPYVLPLLIFRVNQHFSFITFSPNANQIYTLIIKKQQKQAVCVQQFVQPYTLCFFCVHKNIINIFPFFLSVCLTFTLSVSHIPHSISRISSCFIAFHFVLTTATNDATKLLASAQLSQMSDLFLVHATHTQTARTRLVFFALQA